MINKWFALFMVLFLCTPVWGEEKGNFDSLLSGVNIQKDYQPGMGKPVGKVLSVKGKAFICHVGEKKGFWADKDLSLFKGDTIVTLEESSLEIGLADASRISIGSETRLAVNEMLYCEKPAERSGFLSLTQGKARFWIKKLIQFRRSEFRVKTSTAIAGVRGSDFIVWAASGFTEFTTFEDTRLEVLNPSDPGTAPVILKDFQRSRKPLDKPPSPPKPVDLTTLRGLQESLPFSPTPPLGSPVRINRERDGSPVSIPKEMLVPPSSLFQGADRQGREPETLEDLRYRTRQGVQGQYEDSLEERQKAFKDTPSQDLPIDPQEEFPIDDNDDNF